MDIGTYRTRNKLKLAELADRIGCSKGHACDLNSGKASVTPRIARRMEKLTGIPWWKWMDPAKAERSGAAR